MQKKRGFQLLACSMILCMMLVTMPVIKTDAANGTVITITQDNQVVDTFNGVNAVYRPGSWDGTDSTYGCHAYVIRYYQAIYGKTVYNLFHGQTPMTAGDSFVQVTNPQPGDICAQIKASSNHWSIVKSVSGSTVNVIDQNNKWMVNGVTYAYKNFSYNVSEVVFYRLASVANGGSPTAQPTTAAVQQTTAQQQTTQAVAAGASCAMSVNCGRSKQITAQYMPEIASQPVSSWTSSDSAVASVSASGLVTGVQKGSAIITAALNDGRQLTLDVKVKVPATSLKLSSKDVTIPKSYRWQMAAKMKPVNTTDKLTFKSSNKKVATVTKKGLVKTKKRRGRATITVRTTSGKKKKCIVRVY